VTHEWTDRSIATSKDLYDVWGADGSAMYACGWDGALFRSEDDGRTWEALDSGVRAHLFCMAGVHERDLFAVGHYGWGSVALHSRDGRKFRKLSVGRPSTLRAVAVWGDEVYLLGGRGVLCSTDHGKTFRAVYSRHDYLRAIVALGPGHVVAGGRDAFVVATRDGGASWNFVKPPMSSGIDDLCGRAGGPVFALGFRDVVRTDDGGASWASVLRGRVGCLSALASSDAGELFVAYESGANDKPPRVCTHALDDGLMVRSEHCLPRTAARVRDLGDGRVVVVGKAGMVAVRGQACTPPPKPAEPEPRKRTKRR
jgi:photosystem II stability/assembly factor-like uncharacterized protein